jgi:hypothetical protein
VGIADPAGFTREISQKPGIRILAPGEARRFAMTITVIA